jgi:hypothetical protein
MHRKKIAIYVEGQTEHLLVYHLILTWWSYSGIQIQNTQLRANEDRPSKVPNFLPEVGPEHGFFFHIIDVQGDGTLASAMKDRANKQHELGYDILALRDLYPDNDPSHLIEKFQMALKKIRCLNPEKIDLFSAIMEIEAWLLAFSGALSKWAKGLNPSIPTDLEKIPRPSSLMAEIGKSAGRNDHKTYHNISSFVASITREDILGVYASDRIPSFSRFWKKMLSLSE